MAALIPISRPALSSSGPPGLPGLMAVPILSGIAGEPQPPSLHHQMIIAGTATPVGMVAVPAGMAATPVGMVALPVGMATVPSGMAAVPTAMVIVPSGMEAAPVGMATVPLGMVARPVGM